MGFVESVVCKAFHFIVNGNCRFFINPTANASFNYDISIIISKTVNEYFTLRLHYGKFFLAHCTAHYVRSAETVACKRSENLHDLFLINYATACNSENFL